MPDCKAGRTTVGVVKSAARWIEHAYYGGVMARLNPAAAADDDDV